MFRRRSAVVVPNGEGSLIGLDVNATRVRAVSGPPGTPQPFTWDEPTGELPMAVSLEGRSPEVGRAGVALCRRWPHLACIDFLPHLGQPKQWTGGRHRLDAAGALSLALQRLQTAGGHSHGFAAAVPPYLTEEQVELFAALAEKAKLAWLASVSAPLAAAWSALAEKAWSGAALVADVDDHALMWTVVSRAATSSPEPALSLSRTLTLSPLGLRAWRQRLLNAIAERCIRHSRRDPRECAAAEQMLYEQLDAAMQKCRQGEMTELDIQATHWYQNFYLRPDELELYCAPLVQPGIDGMEEALTAAEAVSPPAAIIVTAAAARLPGLLAALQDHTAEQTQILTLPPDAIARAAHDLAVRVSEGRVPHGHLQRLPTPSNDSNDCGIRARLTGTDR